MNRNQTHADDDWTGKLIEEELTPQGDLLPPWQKYPDLPRHSLGWRMGYGESYVIIWDEWASRMNQGQLIDYFRRYIPIPVEWLPWVSNRFGDESIFDEMISGDGRFEGIRWLEQQGLGSFNEFKSWYDKNWRVKKD